MKNNKCFFSYILILLNLILGFVSFFYIFFWIRAGNSFLFTFCSEELFTFAWIITPWINLVLLFISLWQIFYKAVLFLCFLIGIIINLYLFFGCTNHMGMVHQVIGICLFNGLQFLFLSAYFMGSMCGSEVGAGMKHGI